MSIRPAFDWFCVRAALWLAAIATLFVALPSAVDAQPLITGQTPGGANYSMRVPPGWRAGDPLVMVNHGYSFEFDNDVDLGPLQEHQLAQGYAVIASGYRIRGWALWHAIDDNAALYDTFVARHGAPGYVIAAGGSMGGLISLKQAEDPRFRATVRGVYALCPPAAGARSWESGFDLKLGYDAICRGVGGGEFPRGPAPYDWVIGLDQIPPDLSDLSLDGPMVRALARIQQCTGLLVPAFLRTSPQRDRLRDLKRLSGIADEDFLALNLGYALFGMADLVRSPMNLGGRNPFDNRFVRYVNDPAAFDNRGLEGAIQRVAAEPFAALDLRAASDLRGATDARVISLHTSGDVLVIPEHQEILRTRYAPSRTLSAIVREDRPTHCEFSRAELVAGWEATREAAAGAPVPTAAALQSRCNALATSGAEPGPCRIESGTKLAPLDARIAPRPWRPTFAAPGRWMAVDVSSQPSVNLWLQYAAPGDDLARPRRGEATVAWTERDGAGRFGWFVGDGEVYDNGLIVRDVRRAAGGRFGVSLAPRQLAAVSEGEAAFVLDPKPLAGEAPLRQRLWARRTRGGGDGVAFPPRFEQIKALGLDQPLSQLEAWAGVPGLQGLASNGWVADGFGGVMLLQTVQTAPTRALFVSRIDWLSFDALGNPVHFAGESPTFGDDWSMTLTRVDAPNGSAAPTITLSIPPPGAVATCAPTTIRYTSSDPTFGSGVIGVARLTFAFGSARCP